MKHLKHTSLLLVIFLSHIASPTKANVDFSSPQVIDARTKEGEQSQAYSLRIAQLYELPENSVYKNITQDILLSNDISENSKTIIKEQQRTFILFTYPSDGHHVKAVISYTPDSDFAPLLFFLRGGNRLFGLMNPGHSFNLIRNYTVISPVYRGGASEGTDEFGGNDVNDIKNLVDFLPQLAALLNIPLQPTKKYIIGASRGGMQMFLALQRTPFLQTWFDKAVSLSGLLDMNICIEQRPDMKDMFCHDFGLRDTADTAWISHRNPIEHCDALHDDFPILIIQGTCDNRSPLSMGTAMVDALKNLGKNVTYWECDGATHCLSNMAAQQRNEMIVSWLAS